MLFEPIDFVSPDRDVLNGGLEVAPSADAAAPKLKTTFRLWRQGHEVRDMAMGIEATDLAEARITFDALWRSCSIEGDVAALMDETGRVIWGAERPPAR